jgi:tRNA(Arg) A34 adenosine deaminase TadA
MKVYSYLNQLRKNMVGNITKEKLDKVIKELFVFCKYSINKTGWPYVSFVLKRGVIVAKDFNNTRQALDPTLQCSVSAIRKVLSSLETNDLAGHSLLSLFEPTILSFDIALWAGIKDFIWCINAKSAPEHYNKMSYSPLIYASKNPGKVNILSGVCEKEALEFLKSCKGIEPVY